MNYIEIMSKRYLQVIHIIHNKYIKIEVVKWRALNELYSTNMVPIDQTPNHGYVMCWKRFRRACKVGPSTAVTAKVIPEEGDVKILKYKGQYVVEDSWGYWKAKR